MRRAAAVSLALVALTSVPDMAAGVELDRGDLRLELNGSLRTLATLTRDVRLDELERRLQGVPVRLPPRRSDSGLLLLRARIDAQAVWRDRLYAQVVYDNTARFGSGLDTFSFAVADAIGNRTWADLDRTPSSHDDANWRHSVYRAWVRFEQERVELTLGRQRIPLGRGRFWNPIDLFNPIPPLAIEAQQSIGQDAARLRFRLQEGVWSEAIWSPQDDPDDHRGALRLEVSRTELDLALMVGSFRRNWVFGADGEGNLGGAAYRFEATYTDDREGGRTWQVVGSLDYTFALGSGLYGMVEHFYNENLLDPGEIEALLASCPLPLPGAARQCIDAAIAALAGGQGPVQDRLVTSVRNQTGVALGYDLTPLVRANLISIYDWHGPSVAIFPVLAWSVRSDVDLELGVQVYVGPDDGRSEYGERANLLFAQVDFFF